MLWALVSAIITLIIVRTGVLSKTADKLASRGLLRGCAFQRSWWYQPARNALVDFQRLVA